MDGLTDGWTATSSLLASIKIQSPAPLRWRMYVSTDMDGGEISTPMIWGFLLCSCNGIIQLVKLVFLSYTILDVTYLLGQGGKET